MSIFDQFNEQNTTSYTSERPVIKRLQSNSGYVSVNLKSQSDGEIFKRQKMQIDLQSKIVNLAAINNNWMVLLLSSQLILRMNMKDPNSADEIFVDKFLKNLKISKLFLDPTGCHLLISALPVAPVAPGATQTAELYYLNKNSQKPKLISKFKGVEITAVAFNFENQSEQSTGSILMGSSKGLIFETELSVDGERVSQPNWKQLPNYYLPIYGYKDIENVVFDIGQGANRPITGIAFHRAPTTQNYIVLVSTLDRLYTFHETLKPQGEDKTIYLQQIFNSYLNVPEEARDFHDVSSSLNYSKLCCAYEKSLFPKACGWLTEPGIYYCTIAPLADSPKFVDHAELIPYPKPMTESFYDNNSMSVKSNAYAVDKNVPISFVLTDFHAILLFADRIRIVSLINYEVVKEDGVPNNEKFIDVVRDVGSGFVYVIGNKFIYRYVIKNEQRNVWRMYLDKNEFGLALKYSNDNPAFKDIINAKQAEICFAQNQFIECARIYADTQRSFEEICLKFLQVNENRALLVYLKKRLANLDPLEKTQITMLVVWIVDIYLNEMRKQEDSSDLRREFEAFITLPFVVESMRQNRHIFYEIMTAHGDSQNLTVLTKLNRDYEYVINMHINDEQYAEALSVLRESNKMELYYKHCPVLMGYLPKETVRAIIAADKRLDPVRLIKNLVNPLTNRSDCVNELIRYLEYCVHSMNVEQGLVHNLLIEYYAKHGHGDKLVEFLETQDKEVSMLHYDVLHALRISEQYNIIPATVFLKCLLELWQEAVESALTYDIQIAKRTASMPSDSSMRKRLWLIIANHEIGHSKDPVKALQILEECDLLKIEDILPFLPDFEKIDDIKELICNSLKEYNARIEEQKHEMDESDKSAQRVRNELQSFKGRVIRFSTDTVCDLCNFYLIKRDYQLYQCGHKYHKVCYEHELKALFDKYDKIRPLRHSITDSCLQCGEIMISLLDQPFENDDREWK